MRINAEALIPSECFGKKYIIGSVVSYMRKVLSWKETRGRKNQRILGQIAWKFGTFACWRTHRRFRKLTFAFHYPSPLDQNNEEGYSNLLLKHQARGSLPMPGSNGFPCFWRPKMAGKNKSRQYLLWPQFLLSSNHPCPTIQQQSWSCFIKTNMNVILTTALGLYFLQKFPASCQTYWINLHAIVLLLYARL